jgi:hypothetical protein
VFVLVASRGGVGQFFRHLVFNPFPRGLYQLNTFDLCLLVPYFVVLILLASYGMHRYVLVYL